MNYDGPVPKDYANGVMRGTAAQNAYGNAAVGQPPAPTRFSSFAGQLEARVAHLASMVDRFSRVADRLGGSMPEEAQAPGKIRGTGGNIASQIEASLEDFEALMRRAERTAERLETL